MMFEQLHITIKSLTPALQHHILSFLEPGLSSHQISSQTGVSNATISAFTPKQRVF